MTSLLEQSYVLSELKLFEGSICRLTSEDDGLLHIAEALQTNSSLTKLNLCSMELKQTQLTS